MWCARYAMLRRSIADSTTHFAARREIRLPSLKVSRAAAACSDAQHLSVAALIATFVGASTRP